MSDSKSASGSLHVSTSTQANGWSWQVGHPSLPTVTPEDNVLGVPFLWVFQDALQTS